MITYRYCPECRHELVARETSYYCPGCQVQIWLTSHVGTGILLADTGHILFR